MFEQTQNIHFNEKKYVAAEVLQYEKNAQMKDEFLIWDERERKMESMLVQNTSRKKNPRNWRVQKRN